LRRKICQTAPTLSPAAIDEIGGRPTRGVFAGHERIVGSVANLIVAERARSYGVIINFPSYFVVGAPADHPIDRLWGVLAGPQLRESATRPACGSPAHTGIQHSESTASP
jgi:hypothetical protein